MCNDGLDIYRIQSQIQIQIQSRIQRMRNRVLLTMAENTIFLPHTKGKREGYGFDD